MMVTLERDFHIEHFFFFCTGLRFLNKEKRLSEQDHRIIEFKDLYLTHSRKSARRNV